MSVPPRAELPAGVEPSRITTTRGELAALRAGDPRAEAVLLVPGFTGSKEDFLPILAQLAEAGLFVTAIDQRGQFESPGTGQWDDYDLAGFTADLVDVIADLAGRVHLVGHSFGGVVTREAFLARPESVATVTLMDSGPGALPESRWPALRALIALVPHATMDQIWQAKLELDRQAGAPPLPADVAEFLRARWVANDGWSMAGIARILMSVPDRTDALAAALSEHDAAAMVMYGEWDETAWHIDDQVTMGRRLGAHVVSIPGAAHSPAVENPAATATELVGFVTRAGV